MTAPGQFRRRTTTTDELLSMVADDMTALRTTKLLVTLPDSDGLWEVSLAPSLGIPVCTDVVALAAIAAA